MTRNHSARCHQAGVGMLEVLIAVLIVSIGFLGMAALHARALSTNNSAMARSMATVASYSILDAMRVDRNAAMAGAYNTTVSADGCAAGGGSLSSAQLGQWCQELGAALGATDSTTGTIACGNTGICTVTIQFDDTRAGAGGSDKQQVTTRAAL
ncbi:MAG: type IV pilus modification protein PilV [Rhodanobacteraceae bacterium]